jgi:hypothetical protein
MFTIVVGQLIGPTFQANQPENAKNTSEHYIYAEWCGWWLALRESVRLLRLLKCVAATRTWDECGKMYVGQTSSTIEIRC